MTAKMAHITKVLVDSFVEDSVFEKSVDEKSVVLHREESAPMHALLSLANTESHNFTAEVLMREAANSWDLGQASLITTRWLQAQGVPMAGVRIRDGSGLSRRITLQSFADRSQNRDPAAIGTYLIGDENYQIQMLHMHCRFLDFSKKLLAFCN